MLLATAAATMVGLGVRTPLASAQAAPSAATPISDSLRIDADNAASWTADGTRVVLAEHSVRIVGDGVTLTADKAVLWITPSRDARTYAVQVALMGNAKVVQGDVTREGGELYVTAAVRPDLQLNVVDLLERDRSADPIYTDALRVRGDANTTGQTVTPIAPPQVPPTPTGTPPRAGTQPGAPTTQGSEMRPRSPVVFQAQSVNSVVTADSKLAIVLKGDVLLLQTRETGDRIELRGDSAVLFTSVPAVNGQVDQTAITKIDPAKDFEAAYLDGDARATFTPSDLSKRSEQRLRASRLLYDFQTDRAMLTDAVFQTTDATTQLPLAIRAEKVRRTASDSYELEHARLSTSSLVKPEFALGATKINLRQEPASDPRLGTRTVYHADNVTFRTFDVPWFWLPFVGGDMTERGGALRRVGFNSGRGFGFGTQTVWGLFESLGQIPPRGLDASYRLDYYTSRGFAGGLDASYIGNNIADDTHLPSSYDGTLSAYFARDNGTDRLGGDRQRITWDDDIRGQFFWRHQQFFDEHWQLQAQLGYLTDPTFREEWFENDFNHGLPIEDSIYLKRQQDSEVISFYANYDVSAEPSIADELQEIANLDGEDRPFLVQRLPEIQYHRIAQPIGDSLTWHSNNSLSAIRLSATRANASGKNTSSLANKGSLGLRNRDFAGASRAGIPSYGYTGFTDDQNFRGDFRQEISYPLQLGDVKAVPYGVLRFTDATESPDGSNSDRLLAGAGLRLSTQFWRTYDDVQSELFDIHRVRHVIEPGANFFISGASADRDDFYIYDEGIDGITDIQMAQFTIKQKWQTKRSAPDKQRTVDFFTLNTGVNLFANQPDTVPTGNLNGQVLTPNAFRSVAFTSEPEASLPRSGFFADATWRVSDTTALLADANYNFDSGTLATTALGLAVQRDPRVRYFAGVRYIGEINSTIATIAMNYQISAKYSVQLMQSFQITDGQNQTSSVTLNRKFQQFTFSLNVYYDAIDDSGGFSFGFMPNGLSRGLSTNELTAQ
ncbi:MAG: LPS assembly protein LptD [Tepidisphaeraceae bacterium]